MMKSLIKPKTYTFYSKYKNIENAVDRNMQENNHFNNNIALQMFLIVASPTPTSKPKHSYRPNTSKIDF